MAFVGIMAIINQTLNPKLIRWLVLGAVGCMAFVVLVKLNPSRFVQNGENLVVFSWFEGVKPQALGPGFHVVTPLISTTYPFDIKTQALTWKEDVTQDKSIYGPRLIALSQDGQEIRLEVTLQYRVVDAPLVFSTLGPDYINRIAPIVRSVIVSETAGFSAQDLYSTQRPILQAKIREQLSSYLNKFGISVLDFLLRDVSFSEDFVQVIEAKTIAENQLAQKSFEIEQARQEARTTIAEAQAEAGKLKAKANALTNNPKYLDVVRSNVFGETLDTLVTK
jgi:regulator of protease activity HflC (stomatin/prohibitin superfamily)